MRVNKYDYQQPVVANQPSYNKTVISPDKVRYCGVVESLNVEKCFGFIYSSDFKDRLFFRTNGGVFRVGCKVNFSVSCSDRGPVAVDVKASFR